METQETIGALIRSLRESKGWTQKRLAEAAGISQTHVTNIENSYVRTNGNVGNSFALQGLLGHTDMKQTAGYVRIANLNLAEQHVLASPMDNLRRK